MRNILIFCLALALVLVGEMALSQEFLFTVPNSVLIERVTNVKSLASTDRDAVEVDGIRFETVVPERVLTIPPNQPNTNTPVRLGIRITNKTQEPIRFSRYNTLFPNLVGADSQALPVYTGSDALVKPGEFDFPLAMPEKNVMFFLEGMLSWHNNKLYLECSNGLGGFWYFDDLKPGMYQVQFTYKVHEDYKNHVLKDFWTGQVATPFVQIHLVQQ